MGFAHTLGGTRYLFPDLRTLLARATPARSGDALAGLSAASAAERVAAQRALADLPLPHFLDEAVIPYEADEVTRLILDGHDAAAFAPVRSLTVGGFRDWLLGPADSTALATLRPGLTPEMVAAVSKIMRVQDLVSVAAKCWVTTRFRDTIGLPGTLSVRLQPNDPVDDPRGVAAQVLDGLLLGANLMYFETGQGSALSADAHHGVDQQTLEARAHAVARAFDPLLCNSVVGFIGPEYLFDGKQILRAGLEDHLCGKLLGLPMGVDICHTNHAEADADDMDALLTLLGVAGVTYVMGVAGADDVMLAYQSTSFHDALYARRALGRAPAPEFAAWMARMGIEPLAEGPARLPPRLSPALIGLA